MLSYENWSKAVTFAREGTLFADSAFHGEEHWRAVAAMGITIADLAGLGPMGRGAAALFGLFHDCRRENDGWDPEHGARAMAAFQQWAEGVDLPREILEALPSSLHLHDHGRVSSNPLEGLGWDADRSTLDRVGITPHHAYFSCVPEAAFEDILDIARDFSFEAPHWDTIYKSAFEGAPLQ